MQQSNCLLEIDTDGLLLDIEPDIDRINSFIKKSVLDKYKISTCFLEMEKERFERGFIHRMKNYILVEKHKNGELKPIVHGAYFVSSRASKVYDDAVKHIIKYVMDDTIKEEDVREKAMDIRQRPIQDFVMRVMMSKKISDYHVTRAHEVLDNDDPSGSTWKSVTTEIVYTDDFSMSGNQIVALAKQMHTFTGIMPEKGTTISYIISKDPVTGRKLYEYYNPKDENQISRVAYHAYEESITKLMNATKIAIFENTRQEENWLQDMLDK